MGEGVGEERRGGVAAKACDRVERSSKTRLTINLEVFDGHKLRILGGFTWEEGVVLCR